MNKTSNLTLSGLTMLIAGIILYMSEQIGISMAKILIPILFILSGGFAIRFSKYSKLPIIAQQYHKIQGIGLIIFALLIIGLPNTLVSFLMIITYFVIMFGIFEITFALNVLSSKHKINTNILISRLSAGAISLIGGFILLLTTLKDEFKGMSIASILIIISGISIIYFAQYLKKLNL